MSDDTVTITLSLEDADALANMAPIWDLTTNPREPRRGRLLRYLPMGRDLEQRSVANDSACRIVTAAREALDTMPTTRESVDVEPTPVPDEDHGFYCGPAIPSGTRPPRAPSDDSAADAAPRTVDGLQQIQLTALRRDLDALRADHDGLRESYEQTFRALAKLQTDVRTLSAKTGPDR